MVNISSLINNNHINNKVIIISKAIRIKAIREEPMIIQIILVIITIIIHQHQQSLSKKS